MMRRVLRDPAGIHPEDGGSFPGLGGGNSLEPADRGAVTPGDISKGCAVSAHPLFDPGSRISSRRILLYHGFTADRTGHRR